MKLFFPLKYIVYKCYSCFRPGMGLFFIVTLVYTCRLFLLHHQKIFIPYIVLVTVRLSLFRNEILFLLSNTLSTKVTVVSDQGWAFFFIDALVYTCRAFFCCIIKNIYPIYIVLVTVRLSLFHNETLFLLSNTLSTNVTVVSDQGWAFSFSLSHLSTLVALFFALSSKKYFSHILFWSQLVSVCFAMKFIFSFKIHCLQRFQLFQTRDGPFVFIVTLVYTCRAFFAVSSGNIYPI